MDQKQTTLKWIKFLTHLGSCIIEVVYRLGVFKYVHSCSKRIVTIFFDGDCMTVKHYEKLYLKAG